MGQSFLLHDGLRIILQKLGWRLGGAAADP